MKINEVLTESAQVDEATPYGGMQRLKTGVKSFFGNKAAQGQGEVGKRANELHDAFLSWASRTGINMSAVPQNEIKEWLESQGLPFLMPTALASTDPVNLENPQTSSAVWNAISQASFKAAGSVARGTPKLGSRYGIKQQKAPPPVPPTPPPPPPPVPPTPRGPTPRQLRDALGTLGVTLDAKQLQKLARLLRGS